MLEQLLVLAVVFCGIAAADWKRLRQASRREKVAWGCMMAFCLYLGADLLMEARLPQVSEFLDWTVGETVRAIDSWFRPDA